MSAILLAIKPEYVNKIFDSSKKYEFRKRLARKKTNKIIVYSSYSEQKVIGKVEVIETLSLNPLHLWEVTKIEAGISKERFMEYFKNSKTAYAYKLGKITKYKTFKTLNDFGIKNAPQSFVYIND